MQVRWSEKQKVRDDVRVLVELGSSSCACGVQARLAGEPLDPDGVGQARRFFLARFFGAGVPGPSRDALSRASWRVERITPAVDGCGSLLSDDPRVSLVRPHIRVCGTALCKAARKVE